MTARPRPRGFAMRHLSAYPNLTTYAVPLPDGSYNATAAATRRSRASPWSRKASRHRTARTA